MDREEAAKLIRAIAESLTDHPDQFHLQVSVVGATGISYGGGTGISSTAIGGGPGSSTVGFQATVNMRDVEIARGRASDEVRQQMQDTSKKLIAIANDLESSSPNVGRIQKIYESVKNTWIPGVITSVVGNVLTMALGS